MQEKTNKAKGSMFNRMVNQLGAAAVATAQSTAASGTGASAQAAAALIKFSGIAEKNAEKPGEDPVKEEDGVLSLDTAERMLKWHAEAIGRCVVLSSSNDV